jgi:hypothetical protein
VAPLNPNSTKRYFYEYQNSQNKHVLMVRASEGATDADVDGDLALLMGDIGGNFVASVFTGATKADAGSDIALPFSSGAVGDSFGTGTAIKQYDATALTFVGRTPGGRRTKVSIFGFKNDLSEFRMTSAESSDVANAVGHLNSFGFSFIAIDSLTAVWNGYADIKANDHWVKKAR